MYGLLSLTLTRGNGSREPSPEKGGRAVMGRGAGTGKDAGGWAATKLVPPLWPLAPEYVAKHQSSADEGMAPRSHHHEWRQRLAGVPGTGRGRRRGSPGCRQSPDRSPAHPLVGPRPQSSSDEGMALGSHHYQARQSRAPLAQGSWHGSAGAGQSRQRWPGAKKGLKMPSKYCCCCCCAIANRLLFNSNSLGAQSNTSKHFLMCSRFCLVCFFVYGKQMGLPGCLFVCLLNLLLVCFLFNTTGQMWATGRM